MNDPKKKKQTDSTTDFFLQFVKEEKSEKEKTEAKKGEREQTYTKTVEKVSTGYNYFNKLLDKLLENKHSVRILSFVLALFLFVSFSGGDVMNSTTAGATLKKVPVQVEGLKDRYDVSGVPPTVEIGLIGPSMDIYTTKLTSNYEVYCDLSEYNEGTHHVTLKTRNFDSDLTVMLIPETVTVKILPKVDAKFDLGYKFINQDKLNEKYSVSVDSISTKRVTITATQNNLDKIDKVQALIDVEDKTKAFQQACEIKAFDADGNEVQCTIAPEKVNVSCHVDSYSKEVPVKPEFVGQLQEGYQMTNYKLSSSTVTIYGKRTDLSDINYITCQVDISNLSGSTTLSGIALQGNDKINKISQNTIDVTMFIEKK